MQTHKKDWLQRSWKMWIGSAFVFAMLVLLSNQHSFAQSTSDTVDAPNEVEIVGGQNATPGEYPWQVQVWRSTSFCGGVLIHPNWVLTAAHCMGVSTYGMAIVLGAHEFNNPSEVDRQVRTVKRRIIHPQYNRTTLDNDIALVELTSPATINDRVKVIPYAITATDAALFQPGVVSMVTGWGLLATGSTLAPVLQEVTQPMIEPNVCRAVYPNLTDNMICAGYPEGGKSACQGDSGGPLIVPNGEGGWKLAGLVSFGMVPCASAGKYAAFNKVGNYDLWIRGYIDPGSIPVPTPVPVGEVVKNGDFELSNNGDWRVLSPENPATIIDSHPVITAPSGSWFAMQGGSTKHSDEISQTITLPNLPLLYLNYRYQVQSVESGCYYDSAKLLFGRSSIRSHKLCAAETVGNWRNVSIKLSSLYKGKTVDFKVRTTTNLNKPSYFFIDNIWFSSAPAFSSDSMDVEIIEMAEGEELIEEDEQSEEGNGADGEEAVMKVFIPFVSR